MPSQASGAAPGLLSPGETPEGTGRESGDQWRPFTKRMRLTAMAHPPCQDCGATGFKGQVQALDLCHGLQVGWQGLQG